MRGPSSRDPAPGISAPGSPFLAPLLRAAPLLPPWGCGPGPGEPQEPCPGQLKTKYSLRRGGRKILQAPTGQGGPPDHGLEERGAIPRLCPPAPAHAEAVLSVPQFTLPSVHRTCAEGCAAAGAPTPHFCLCPTAGAPGTAGDIPAARAGGTWVSTEQWLHGKHPQQSPDQHGTWSHKLGSAMWALGWYQRGGEEEGDEQTSGFCFSKEQLQVILH